ncbi:hypothetical protein D3C80_1459860 [compost metagenome]
MPARGQRWWRATSRRWTIPWLTSARWRSRPVMSRSATIRCHWPPAAATLSSGSQARCWRGVAISSPSPCCRWMVLTPQPPAASRSGISPARSQSGTPISASSAATASLSAPTRRCGPSSTIRTGWRPPPKRRSRCPSPPRASPTAATPCSSIRRIAPAAVSACRPVRCGSERMPAIKERVLKERATKASGPSP